MKFIVNILLNNDPVDFIFNIINSRLKMLFTNYGRKGIILLAILMKNVHYGSFYLMFHQCLRNSLLLSGTLT